MSTQNIQVHNSEIVAVRKKLADLLERIMEAARRRGCVLEINAQPERLDLSHVYAKLAKEIGVKLAISTDAHRTSDFRCLRHGVDQARRGWVEAEDVVNTRPWDDLKRLLNVRR